MPLSSPIRLSDLREVECFLAVADTLHFGRAAEQLHIPQPHLSRIIRRLERRLAVELFHRTSRRVELTPAGEVLVVEGTAVCAAAQRAIDRVRLASLGAAGSLSLGYIPWAALHALPNHVTAFQSLYPEVHIELTEDTPAQLRDGLDNRTLDIAYMRSVDANGLHCHELTTESYCVVVPKTHPWANLASIGLSQLDGEPFVCVLRQREAPQNYDGLVQPLAAAGVAPAVRIEVPSVTAAIAFVRAGAGFTLITNIHQSLAPDLAFVPLSDVTEGIRLVIASRRADANPIVAAYLAHTRGMQQLSRTPS